MQNCGTDRETDFIGTYIGRRSKKKINKNPFENVRFFPTIKGNCTKWGLKYPEMCKAKGGPIHFLV